MSLAQGSASCLEAPLGWAVYLSSIFLPPLKKKKIVVINTQHRAYQCGHFSKRVLLQHSVRSCHCVLFARAPDLSQLNLDL